MRNRIKGLGKEESNNTQFGMNGEQVARKALRKHFVGIRKQKHLAPFDYVATDRLTGDKVAIEVKTIRKEKGKLVHIENGAMNRKLEFLNETGRKGIVLIIMVNGTVRFFLARLKHHISTGGLVEI